MQYLGDYAEDYATLNFKFSTHKADGTPIALAGTPAVSVYKANGTTQSTAGITLSVDFDSVTGLNNVLIDLSADAFYAVGNDYSVVITTGTVNSVSVVGTVLAHFSIENRFQEADVTKIAGAAVSTATAQIGANIVSQDNIDFGALQKASITAAVPTVDQIHDEVVEGTLTFRKILKILLAFAAGKSTGGGTATIIFRDNADTKARITATADTDGNRTEVTLDGD